MILIEDKIVSDEIIEQHFVCNLTACKGACCVEGEQGAPLEKAEATILEEIYSKIKDRLTPEGRKAIEAQGTSVKKKGKLKTPLVRNKACAYAIFDKGIAQCGIEKAFEEGVTDFRKPISCHLYPVRITSTEEMDFINYEEWDICDPACSLGKELKMPLYKFVKDALIRKYGEEFYQALEAAEQHAHEHKADQ